MCKNQSEFETLKADIIELGADIAELDWKRRKAKSIEVVFRACCTILILVEIVLIGITIFGG